MSSTCCAYGRHLRRHVPAAGRRSPDRSKEICSGGTQTNAGPAEGAGGLAVGATIALTACSGGSGGAASGQVFVTGSSTVEPISIRVAEKITDATDVSVVVEGPGTGDGFKKFCAGEADVTGASRTIKDEEIATCEENGIEFVELPVAVDGLTVATSPENDDVSCLDVPALYALLGPESEGSKRWSDVLDLAYELGSTTTDLPDETLYISGPGEESGTYDAFVEFAIKDIAEERGPRSGPGPTTCRAATTT